MNCPSCKNPMIVLELNEIEIDFCPACKGIWLDEGELEALLKSDKEKSELLKSFQIDEKSKEKKIPCPICTKSMNKINIGDTVVDECKEYHGIFFDEGELLNILRLGGLNNKEVVKTFEEFFEYSLNSNNSGE